MSSYKLLLAAASFSRPKYSAICRRLLQPFVRDGEISLRYWCYNRFIQASIRTSELQSDFTSTLELGVMDIYDLDRSFQPDLVIDGGGNIGLFTLRAAASVGANHGAAVRFVICEPLPENIKQIQKHLRINGVKAEIMPVCLGGSHRSIPFYCREANQSSFDPLKPYATEMEIPVLLLQDAIGSDPAERILVKLDIEGMEIEVLSAFVPSEKRAVYFVGELHNYLINAPLIESIFRENGWVIELYNIADNLSNFRACSPAAVPLLASMSSSRRTTAAAQLLQK